MKNTPNYLKKLSIIIVFAFTAMGLAVSQTEISNPIQLAAITNDLSGNYILTSDISLRGAWTPINNFTGTLDGNGYIIRGLSYDNSETNSVALFSTTSGATIKNLGIENATLKGNRDVAAFIGIMTGGTLEQCYVSNSFIQGADHVASLVGQTTSNALVQNCYATAYIFATTNNTGGLIGSAKTSTIANCYFSGYVRGQGGSWQSGGLVGYTETGHTPFVTNCVNLSPLIISNAGGSYRIITKPERYAKLINNYSLSTTLLGTSYDLSALAIVSPTNTYYGTNKHNGENLPNDADAKSSTFYVNTLGWDFAATTGVWKMLNDGYPVLQWQQAPVNTTILNLNAPDNLSILDYASYPLSTFSQIDFSKLISSHGLSLDVSCDSRKISISEDKIANISSGTTIKNTENVKVNVTTNAEFTISNAIATVTLSPSFPGFLSYPEGMVSPIYNAGPGMAIDRTSVTTEDSKMIVISNTNLESFNTYVQSLLSNGFTQLSTSSIDANLFYTLKYENQLYYLYYTGSKNQVRIIQDNSSTTLIDELDTLEQGTGETEFYLYSLDYTHGEGQTSKSDYWKIDCGALLIMKLKDNSLFIVDAGHERQSSNAALEGLMDFMYQITGQEEGTTINIRAWFFSHAHGDHVYMTYPLLEKYHKVLNIESTLFNIPSYQTMSSGYDSGTFLMKQAFNTYYPNCKHVKLHTGQQFSLQGVGFEVLFTHEDAVASTGKTTIGNFNETSTILSVTMDGKKFMLLGDTDGLGQSSMLSLYSRATIKSDCVQVAHHGYNNLAGLYKAIGAPVALFCNSIENAKNNNQGKYQDVMNAASNVQPLFADPNSYKLTVVNGSIVAKAIPSYRSFFKTVALPSLTVGSTTSSGRQERLSDVLSKNSLADKVIDRSVTGSESISTGESCSLIFDGKTSTKFCTKNIPSTIAWTMKERVTLKWYVIYSANDNERNHGRNPKEWGLFGSNDGTNWVCIDTVYNPKLPNENFVGTAFCIANPVPYQYYALKITSTDGADVLQISEIDLYTDELNSSVEGVSLKGKASIHVRKIGNNQIEVMYEGDLSFKTELSIYNITGQKLTNQQIVHERTILALPATGVYFFIVNNGQANTVMVASL